MSRDNRIDDAVGAVSNEVARDQSQLSSVRFTAASASEADSEAVFAASATTFEGVMNEARSSKH